MRADTFYRAGSGDQLVVKGDPGLVSHVSVRDGVVKLVGAKAGDPVAADDVLVEFE